MKLSKLSIRKIIIILTILCALTSSGCTYFAKQIIYPARQPVVKTPDKYDLKYEPVEFASADNVTIRGWFIAADSNKLIIITHPNGFTKYGYAAHSNIKPYASDVEVEFLKTAEALHNAKYNVLMFDFRNHGESSSSPDGITGIGLNEYKDVVAAVKYIKSRPDIKDDEYGFVSFCMGANSTIIALSKEKEALKDTKCLVAVQPVAADIFIPMYTKDVWGSAVASILPSVEKDCIKMGGRPFSEMSAMPYAKDIFVPTLVVQAKGDKWIDMKFIEDVYSVIPAEKEMLWLGTDMERFDTYNYFGKYPEELLVFLKKHF